MPEKTEARDTLETARFFLGLAEGVGFDGRDVLKRYVAAAIVFGRSVTFHLQKEFAHAQGFAEWYATEQQKMGEDKDCRFFLEARNITLKEGLLAINQATDVTITAPVAMASALTIKVKRGNPVWRRHPRILQEDLRRWVLGLLDQAKQNIRRLRPTRVRTGGVDIRQRPFFDHPEVRDDSAFEVLHRYLDNLERIVADAERRFA